MRVYRIFFVVFTFALRAYAQPTINPSVVRIGAVSNSNTRVSEYLWVFASGQTNESAPFSVTIRYGSTAAEGWLSYTVSQRTTPAVITVSADPSNLAAGTYLAQIIVAVGARPQAAVGSVQFVVAPSTSNPAGVAVNPSGLTFFATPAVEPQTLTILNAPGSSGQRAVSVYGTPATWLPINVSQKLAPGTIEVRPSALGMAPGTYNGAITITTLDNGASVVVPVTLIVKQSAGSGTAALTPAQRALAFNYQIGSGINPVQTVVVSTTSTQYTPFTATTSQPWLTVAATAWASPARSASAFAPGLFYVKVDPNGLSAGVYEGVVTLSASGFPSVDVPVTLGVSTAPVLNANPSYVALDESLSLLTSNLAVTASTPFYFTAAIGGNAPWLSVTPTAAVASGYPVDLTVTANVSKLPPGEYSGVVVLTATSGTPRLEVPVSLKVTGEPVTNALDVAPKSLDFSVLSGDSPPPQYFGVFSLLPTQQNVAISASSDEAWLMVDSVFGATPMRPSVRVNTAVPPGSYTGSIRITSAATGDELKIPVSYTLTARRLAATPATLTFRQLVRGETPPSQELQVSANARCTFTMTAGKPWIRITPEGVQSTPTKFVVSVEPGALPPGSYESEIRIAGPNTISVPVALIIPEPPPPQVAPLSLSFLYEIGSPAPPPQAIDVSYSTASVSYSASASTESGIPWFTISGASGFTPGSVAISFNTRLLTPGKHNGAVTIRVDSTPAKTITVPVAISVTGAAVQIREVLNAASLAPSGLSPGELIVITGIGLGPPEWVSAAITSAGALPADLAGVRVLFDGLAAPLLRVRSGQIDAIVPYAVAGRTTCRIQVQVDASYSLPVDVKVVDAAPGIFTVSGTGRGQASALNDDFTQNSSRNPAPVGSIITVFLTGEGQTNPLGQDGRIINTDLRKPLLSVTARVGNRTAEVTYAGSASTMVSGVCQVNLRVPADLQPGTQPLTVLVGGVPTQLDASIEVR